MDADDERMTSPTNWPSKASTTPGRTGDSPPGSGAVDTGVASAKHAFSNTDTVSGGEEDEQSPEGMPSPIDCSRTFVAVLNKSAVKYNRLPIEHEFSLALELIKEPRVEWFVKDDHDCKWPVSFHREGGMEMIRGWKQAIKNMNLGVGDVIVLFRPDKTKDQIIIEKCAEGLNAEAEGQEHPNFILGGFCKLDGSAADSSTGVDGSAIRHIIYEGRPIVAFCKRLAVGAVQAYGSNPPRLELHHKAAEVLGYLDQKTLSTGGTRHMSCELVNPLGESHSLRLAVRTSVVLRWCQPSFKRNCAMREGDILTLTRTSERGVLSVKLERANHKEALARHAKRKSGAFKKYKARHAEHEGTKKLKCEGGGSRTGHASGDQMVPWKDAVKELAGVLMESKRSPPVSSMALKVSGSPDEVPAELVPEAYVGVSNWLKGLGMGKWLVHFMDAKVTWASISTGLLREEHLREMGIPVGPRLEMVSALTGPMRSLGGRES